MSLHELNDLRRTAKELGVPGYGRMKLVDLRTAVAAVDETLPDPTDAELDEVLLPYAIAAEAKFAETIAAEENAADTDDGVAMMNIADEAELTAHLQRVADECGEDLQTVRDLYDAMQACGDEENLEEAIEDLHAQEYPADSSLGETRHSPLGCSLLGMPHTGPCIKPMHTCMDDDCSHAASMGIDRSVVEDGKTDRFREVVAESREETFGVLDSRQNGKPFRHLARTRNTARCGKSNPLAKPNVGSLDSIDCLDCMDVYTRETRPTA